MGCIDGRFGRRDARAGSGIIGPCPNPAALAVGVFMLVMALGIAGLWTVDIVRSPDVDRSRGLPRARDRSSGQLLVPHWLAEYGTAGLLLGGGLGLLLGGEAAAWAWLVPLGLGALAYTSLNSLGWVLADQSRTVYGVPMAIGLAGALVSTALLLAGAVLPPPS